MALFSSQKYLPSITRLPAPAKTSDCSVFTALAHRRTIRDISAASLPLQIVSNLLWAAFGINRPADPFGVPGRTAASASNSQEMDLYVAMKDGTYLYDAAEHLLRPVVAEDLRSAALTPGQHSVDAEAPLTIIYVADMHRLTATKGYKDAGLEDPEIQKAYCHVDTGMIAANVYLFAATEGLAAWFHNCDKGRLAKAMRLRPEQRVLFAQSVSYPDGA
jgi:hypothetical protein